MLSLPASKPQAHIKGLLVSVERRPQKHVWGRVHRRPRSRRISSPSSSEARSSSYARGISAYGLSGSHMPSRFASCKSSFISHKAAIDLGVAGVSTCGHVPRHPVNALPLRRRVAELGDATVDRLRHAAEFVGIGLALLAEAAVRQPLVESLGFVRACFVVRYGARHVYTFVRSSFCFCCESVRIATLSSRVNSTCTKQGPPTVTHCATQIKKLGLPRAAGAVFGEGDSGCSSDTSG